MSDDLLKLWPHQKEAVQAVEDTWATGIRRTALIMATASGKTITAAHVIKRRGGRALFLVNRDELAEQSARAFADVGMNVGIVKADRDEHDRDVVVGSIQTLQNPDRLARLGRVGLVVCDEAQYSAAGSWQRTLTSLGAFDPKASTVALGLSATLSRSDGAPLGDTWQSVAFTYDVLDGISDGFLTDVTGQRVTVNGLSLARCPIAGGDFAPAPLAEILSSPDVIEATVSAYREHAKDMPGIVFTPDVASAQAYARGFESDGFRTEAIWGDMPLADRRRIIAEYKAGEIQILASCMVLTVGFDARRATCAVIARPTRHAALLVQMIGRVLRIDPGNPGKVALVLDVAGATQDHRLATLADLSTRRIKEVRPGESLKEAAQREIKARNANLAGYVISSEEVDLFHRSRSVWLQTEGGLWFVPVGNAVVYLHPAKQDGLYHVGIKPLAGGRTRPVKLDVPLDLAMSWGEQCAESYGEAWQAREKKSFGLDRRARWRKGPAGQKSIQYARSLGIDPPEGVHAGELSCIIDVYKASAILDRKRN